MTDHKAWASAVVTILMALAALFGVGEGPVVTELQGALMTLATTLVSGVVGYAVTYYTANKQK